MHARKHLIHVVAAAIILICRTSTVQAGDPVVHLLAPTLDEMDVYDPLVAETAIRLTAIELAARYGIRAAYWSSDQRDLTPEDELPRIELRAEPPPRMDYMRMVRRGDMFHFAVSEDGVEWHHWGSHKLILPARCLVGLYVPQFLRQTKVTGWFSDVRLNGEAFVPNANVDIGSAVRPSSVQQAGDKWLIETYGRGDISGFLSMGRFIHVPCEGDFEFQAQGGPDPVNPATANVSLRCRPSLELDSPTIGIASDGLSLSFSSYVPSTESWHFGADVSAHVLRVSLRRGPGDPVELGKVYVSCRDWPTVTSAASRVADLIEAGLARELALDLSHPRGPAPADDAQRASLSEARALALKVRAQDTLAAAERINGVLNSAPTCPQAHRAAAMCGAVAACAELRGYFHERGRYLSVPLSHWLLAERLAPGEGPLDGMTDAWVALACGYANESLAALPEDEAARRADAEGRSLEMFVTRDYRILAPDKVTSAEPIEQLAWTWAVQECDRSDFMDSLPEEIAGRRRSAAFLPLEIGSSGVGPGHTTTVMGIPLAWAEGLGAMTTMSGIPEAQRTATAEGARKFLNMEAARGGASSAEELTREVMEGEAFFMRMSDGIALFEDSFATMLPLPSGQAMIGDPPAWQCLPPREYAALLRGILIRTVQIRGEFIGDRYGVPGMAQEFCSQASAGYARDTFLSGFFNAMSNAYVERFDDARTSLFPVLDLPLGRQPSTANVVADTLGANVVGANAGNAVRLSGGRGCWDWELLYHAAYALGAGDNYDSKCRGMLPATDSCSHESAFVEMWQCNDPNGMGAVAERMPYHLSILNSFGSFLEKQGMLDGAITLLKKAIDLAPTDSTGYRKLAYVLYRNQDTDGAIAVLFDAEQKCEYDLSLSALYSDGAKWLVRKGRLEEGLRVGRLAAWSYSQYGLEARAIAEEANGLYEEAAQTHKAIAERYDTGIRDYVRFMLRRGYPDEKILPQIRQAAAEHQETLGSFAESAARGIVNGGGSPELLEQAMGEKLAAPPEKDALFYTLMCQMNARRFNEALKTFDQMGNRGSLFATTLSNAAARLVNDAAMKEQTETRLLKWRETDYSPLAGYIAGRVPFEELPLARSSWSVGVMAHWLRGVEAECRGDMDAAIESYRTAAKADNDSQFIGMSRRWVEIIEAERAAKKAAEPGAAQ